MNPTRGMFTGLCLSIAVLTAPPLQAQDSAQRSVDVVIDASGRLVPARPRGAPDALWKYWADPVGNRIVRSDGRSLMVEELIAELKAPYGLGFDASTQSLIWTSSGDGVVQTYSLGGRALSTLTTSFDDPPAIELPHEGGRQAITVVGSDIVRVTVDELSDAVDTEVLMSLDATDIVHGLAIDTQSGQLYVGNAVGMMAYKLDLADRTVSRLTYTDHVPPVPDLDEGDLQ